MSHALLTALQIQLPTLHIRSSLSLPSATLASSLPLFNKFKRFPYVIVANRRYTASAHAKTPYDSYVLVKTHALPEAPMWAGELQEIFVVDQPQIGVHRYGFVRWFVPAACGLVEECIWNT